MKSQDNTANNPKLYKSVLVNWETIAMQGPARILFVGKDATNDKKLAETLIGRTRNVDLKVAA